MLVIYYKQEWFQESLWRKSTSMYLALYLKGVFMCQSRERNWGPKKNLLEYHLRIHFIWEKHRSYRCLTTTRFYSLVNISPPNLYFNLTQLPKTLIFNKFNNLKIMTITLWFIILAKFQILSILNFILLVINELKL